MSRYKSGEFEYGYDRPLQEYFLQRVIPTDGFPDVVELVGSLSNKRGNATNMIQAIEEYNVDISDEHKMQIQMDLPF